MKTKIKNDAASLENKQKHRITSVRDNNGQTCNLFHAPEWKLTSFFVNGDCFNTIILFKALIKLALNILNDVAFVTSWEQYFHCLIDLTLNFLLIICFNYLTIYHYLLVYLVKIPYKKPCQLLFLGAADSNFSVEIIYLKSFINEGILIGIIKAFGI